MQSIQALRVNEVHLWQIELKPLAEETPLARSILSEDEWFKVNRLRRPEHRQRALSMRIQLRILLATYLQQEPHSIDFIRDRYGKPQLKNTPLFFNISHSQDAALVAISLHDGLGVDIEHWRPVEQMEGIVKRHFSMAEKEHWKTLTADQHEAVFFHIWTCKEAFIKATGRGLGMGLSRCGFNLSAAYQLEDCPAEYGEPATWSCLPLALGERVSAAVIIKADSCRVQMYRFEPKFPPKIV